MWTGAPRGGHRSTCVCRPLSARVRQLARPPVAAQLRDRTVRRVQAATTHQEHDRWYEIRCQQHRVYWRKATSGRDYEAFPSKDQAQAFIAVCTKFGRDKVVDRHLARAIGQAPTLVSAPATRCPHTITVPAMAAGLTAPARPRGSRSPGWESRT